MDSLDTLEASTSNKLRKELERHQRWEINAEEHENRHNSIMDHYRFEYARIIRDSPESWFWY